MSTTANTQVRLAERPVGLPGDATWGVSEAAVPSPGDGELLIEVQYISVDPAMRGWLRDVRSYMEPIAEGGLMRAQGIGRVVESRHPDFADGEIIAGLLGVQEYAISDGTDLIRIDTDLAPATTWLGLLGHPGLTAYFGLFDVAKIRSGETVVVSGAAGAVGSVVGQLAKLRGCRVVGIAGGPAKCAWLLDELGFDAAIDYKEDDVGKALSRDAPDGIDVYFDNVGGEILDLVLTRLGVGARIVICGAVSQYNATESPPGPKNYMTLLVYRASMIGMLVFDYEDRYDEARQELGNWLSEGKLVAREQIVEGGVRRFPEALLMLFSGANTGKLVLKVD